MLQFLLSLLTLALGVSPVVGQHVTPVEILSRLEERIAHIQELPGLITQDDQSHDHQDTEKSDVKPTLDGFTTYPSVKVSAYNTASDHVIEQVSSQGVAHGKALVDCADTPDSCEENQFPPSPWPRPSVSPIPLPTPVPTSLSLPSPWPCDDRQLPCPLLDDPGDGAELVNSPPYKPVTGLIVSPQPILGPAVEVPVETR